jgi:alcohol dehydrogenase (cytochrome c)
MRSIVFAMLVSASLPAAAFAQSDEDLRNAGKNPAEILTYGMSYSQQRFSPLNQINRQTIKRLVPAWSYSMAGNNGEESQVLIYHVLAEAAQRTR